MATTTFDPAAHPALVDLGSRLRELAGDSSYQAGRDYLRKGLVKQGAVAGTTAYATVSGSTDYRVSVAFGAEVKVSCTCPAHRRNKYCKHVVALCAALLDRPGEFVAGEAPPEVQKPAARAAPKGATKGATKSAKATKPRPEDLRAAGLETVDRLLADLADGGLMSLGPDKLALLEGAGELVRALKLRRLGNLLLALQRAAARQDGPVHTRRVAGAVATFRPGGATTAAHNGAAIEPAAFARLLVDLYCTRRATGAALSGQAALDDQAAEDLLGKTWRDDELEPVGGLEMMEVAFQRQDEGEFRIESSYLADLVRGTIYVDRQITPVRFSGASKPRHRHRLLVDQAGRYPGGVQRRLKLQRVRRAPLRAGDAARFLERVPDSVANVRRALVEVMDMPFGATEVAIAFKPAALVTHEGHIMAVDGEGRALAIEWPAKWSSRLPSLLPPPGDYALFGLLELAESGLRLRCLSVISPALAWPYGPIYDEG